MKNVLNIFCRCFIWLVRIRHRCGYGIHSPFAFSLVRDVIYEKGEYYAYTPLREIRRKTPCHLREKDDKLLFRLSNASMAENIAICGNCSPTTLQYIAAGRRNATIKQIPLSHISAPSDLALLPQSIDFLYVDAEEKLTQVVWSLWPQLSAKALVVVRGIRSNSQTFAAWQELIAHPRIRVSFDLYHFGVCCLEPRFNKENYIINYF